MSTSNSKPKAIIIGAGIAGMACAIDLAANGFEILVLEKNESWGGRARQFQANGFYFDQGPSWYWMPDIFEGFFKKYSRRTSDYFHLIHLDPSYRIFFENDQLDASANIETIYKIFEDLEEGSSLFLKEFLKEAKFKYETGMEEFVRKPSLKWTEYLNWNLLKSFFRMDLFRSIEMVIKRRIKHPYLVQWLLFPILFLGAKPSKTPAIYSLMNYADFKLGSWYPLGGMVKLMDAFYHLALEKGVTFHFNSNVEHIDIVNSCAVGVIANSKTFDANVIVSAADYEFTEQSLLDEEYRQYPISYWNTRVMAPSALLFYLGFDTKLEGLLHHNLFFDASFEMHASEIYDKHSWPEQPLFYVCVPSKTDERIAPPGKENVFILIPISTEVEDSEAKRIEYFEKVMDRIENKIKQEIRSKIIYKRTYCIQDFKQDYNSFKGNAYGLANTLRQTAFLKPKIRHKKIKNLYFAGQLTHPGPGLPPSMISGEIVASLILKTQFQ
ncbi:MAG: phytoene desaturase family protein [Bacteroidota bacterium]|nr:phytoene desaturase family protein [Bacteroidota bacterium]